MYAGVDGDVLVCTILPKTFQIFAAGTDFNYHWWDSAGKPLTLKPHDCFPATATVSPDRKTMATASTDGDLQVVRINDGRTLATIAVPEGAPVSTFWSADSNRVGMVTKTGHVRIYDVDTKELVLDIANAGADYADFNKAGDMIITQNARSIDYFDAKNGDAKGSMTHEFSEKGNLASGIVSSPDRKMIAVCFGAPDDDEDKDTDSPYLFDPINRKSIGSFKEIDKAVTACAWNSDGTKVAFGGKKFAYVYDVATMKPLYKYTTENRVLSLGFNADGKSLLVGESLGGLYLIPFQK